MLNLRWVGAIVVGGALVGCAPKPAPAPQAAPPPRQLSLEEARKELTQADPRVLVGEVADVDPDHKNVAVRGIPAQDLRIGDTISIVSDNANLTAIGTASLVNVVEDITVFHYGTPTRLPRRGDLAVHVPPGPRILPRTGTPADATGTTGAT